MPSEIAAQMSRRAAELGYVTGHFRDMKGMVLAPSVLAFLLWTLWVHAYGFSRSQFWLVAGGLLFGIAAGRAIQRWYRDRFGFVREPEPDFVPSPVLSILNPPAARPSIRRNFDRQPRVEMLWLSLLWTFYGVLSLPDHSDTELSSLIFLNAVLMLLLPRCLYRTPPVVTLQVRRVLAIAAMLLLLGLVVANFWIHALNWTVVFAIVACFFLLAGYDHWLLMHLLPASDSTREEATDE